MNLVQNDIPFALMVDSDHSFMPAEVPYVLENFVCAVCHAELVEIQVAGEQRRMIVCLEHGNVCEVGRVTRATVNIEMERAYKSYHEVIRNLFDLWGHLAEQGFEYRQANIITKNYVCAVCGGDLYQYIRNDHPKGDIVNIKCQRHGNINECGHIKKSEFIFNFQSMRDWEKSHPRR